MDGGWSAADVSWHGGCTWSDVALVDVLIPTYRRKTGLAVVLTSLLGQSFTDFDVTISDQTLRAEQYLDSIEIKTLIAALRWHGHRVNVFRNMPPRGMAQQRQYLLEHALAPYVHFLDDDVLLDPPVMQRMLAVLREESCGFVGCPAAGLDYLSDFRPHQQNIELWEGPVEAEDFSPEKLPWDRHLVNSAANALHLEKQLSPRGEIVRYKVAWVGGANVLYDRLKLIDVGGFSWWRMIPERHAGEEVVAQFLLVRKHGGCGLLPSGTYHLGLPTAVEDRTHNATQLFEQLIERYNVHREEQVKT